MNIDTIPTSTDGQAQDPESRHRPSAAMTDRTFHGGPINILIVDDEPKNLTVLETILDNPGYRLVRAESADQALLALVDEEFALLILDVRMPEMTGFELAQLIKERKKTARVPIIFLTAYYNEDQHVLKGYGTGAVDYLHKPVNPAVLRSKVAVFAELHNKNRALLAEVTERRRAEEQLRELNETLEQRVAERTEALRISEARYRDLIHALPAALYTCDERGRITLYNQAAVALWGREPEIGKDLWCGSWKIFRPDGAPLPFDECPMAVTLREGRAIRGEEIVIERPDGTRRHVMAHPDPLRNAEGMVVGAINMLIDITDRKRAEQALVDSREELRRALEFEEAVVTNMGEGLYTVNDQGLVTSVNEAAEKLFGWTREELLGRKMHQLTHYKHRDGTPFPAEECAGLQVLCDGKSLIHHEDVFLRKDGSFFDVVFSASPIRAGGQSVGLVVVFRDVSEQKRVSKELMERDLALTAANDALKTHTVALAEANKELEGFSYSVSHDLRAPLRTIDAFSRIVEEDHGPDLNAEARRSLAIVRKAAAQAGELIDDLLEFSRLGRQGMNFHLVEMADLAREAADDLKIMREGRQIALTIGDLPSCQGDRRFLKLVWINLLVNAFKYTKNRNESRIEVGWMPDDARAEAVTYYVKDDGIGFDMKYAHKLFGVFQRLHRKEDFDGTGVGLAIVQRIVLRHGGRVWAEGKVDVGATFYFSLRRATVR
jgi:PAS domain S-box-containing protein